MSYRGIGAPNIPRDTVPVRVDAICFWLVWDAQKSVCEVENYYRAIALSTQTALRDTIGTHTLQDMLTRREALGKALQEVLDRKTNPWGITVQSVEVRDVTIPENLQNALFGHSLNTYGWVYLIVAIILLLSSFGVLTGNPFGRWIGIFAGAILAISAIWWMPV